MAARLRNDRSRFPGAGTLPLQVEILYEHLKASGPRGQSLAECAQATGRDTFDVAIDLQDLRVKYDLVQTVPNEYPVNRWRAKKCSG